MWISPNTPEDDASSCCPTPRRYRLNLNLEEEEEDFEQEDDTLGEEGVDQFDVHPTLLVCTGCYRTFTHMVAWTQHYQVCITKSLDKPEKWCHKRTI